MIEKLHNDLINDGFEYNKTITENEIEVFKYIKNLGNFKFIIEYNSIQFDSRVPTIEVCYYLKENQNDYGNSTFGTLSFKKG